MLSFVEISMNMQTAMSMPFTTEWSGVGDIKLSGLYRLFSSESYSQWLLNLVFSLPTGSIDEEDFLPAIGAEGQLPFPMQIGAGTMDLRPNLTFAKLHDHYSYGSQIIVVLRLDEKAALPVANMMGRTLSTVDPDLRGGESIDIAVGINTLFGEQEHRIAFELVYPIEQGLNGSQLGTDTALTLGYQYTF